jgi:CAAX protease family protein
VVLAPKLCESVDPFIRPRDIAADTLTSMVGPMAMMMDSKVDWKRPVASPIHTVGLLVILAVWTWRGVLGMIRVQGHAAISLTYTYSITIVLEWLVVAYVAWGIRRNGGSLRDLIGGRWSRRRDVLRDALIALGFWIVVLFCMAGLGLALHVRQQPQIIRLLAPEGALEIAGWLLLSCTAGFCEEIIFRGYLQRQFTAMSGSVPVGILLSAIIFGAVHLYQGGKRIIMLVVFGAMLGTLAHLRRSLRPGMMTHAWQDSLVGLLIRFVPK